ncbi:hypothetical protein U9M48_043355, partial [Paspalum notatum var. saurae]
CREDGRKEPIRGDVLDNRWVIPYNPYLLRLFNCHINVEACGSIKVVKYIFKYIYNGHDRASVAVSKGNKSNGNVDEIKEYRDARWVTPPEALWRIYSFDLSENSLAVKQLQLHLPNLHMVSFHEHRNIKRVINRPGADRSMLTAYFEANREDEDAMGILYRDFLEYYTWQEGKSMGKDIDTYPLPKIIETYDDARGTVREEYEERIIEPTTQDMALKDSHNEEQKAAYDKILSTVDTDNGGVFFVDGPGGTGKTYLFTKQSGTAMLLHKASLIIWDEASMTKRQAVDALDNSLRDIMDRPRLPFGGKTVVFGGDFRHVLPVVHKGTRAQIVAALLRKSYLWESMIYLKLVRNMRAQSDPWFIEYLLRIGGSTEETNSDSEIRLPDDGEQMVYHSFDFAVDDPHNYYPPEFLNTLTPNGLPSYVLKLKIGCPFKRKQFPVRISFAMTVNKAQGQSIPNVGVYLPEPVFSHG